MAGTSTPIDNTSYAAFLKKYYFGRKFVYQVDDYVTPYVGLASKALNGGGSTWEQAVAVSNVVGGSATYTNMYANSSQGLDKVFSGVMKHRYADFKVQNATIRACMNNNSIIPVMKAKVDSLRSEFFQTINKQMYGDEGGSKIQLAACSGSNIVFNGTATATDATKAGVQFVKNGMVLNMGANLDGTSLEQSAGTPLKLTISGRNVLAGTITYTAGSANAHPSGSAYLFEDGTAGLALAGNRSWCPLTDTLAATTFKTVDRSTDVNALGGIRVAGVGETIEETLNDAVAQHRALGGDPDAVLIHPRNFSRLKKEMSGRLQWVETKGKPLVGGSNSFSFRGLQVDGNGRPVVVYEDPACQTECTWVVDTRKTVLLSIGTWPYVPNEDGLMIHRIIGTDQWQSELFGDLEFVCGRPQSLLAICHDNGIT